MSAALTIEQGLSDILAEHDLKRLDVGLSNYSHGPGFIATAWWPGANTCEYCTFGHGQTVDDAVNDALDSIAEKRAGIAADMAAAA